MLDGKEIDCYPVAAFESAETTSQVMLDVIYCAYAGGSGRGDYFGLRALVLIAVCAMSCVVLEYLFCVVVKKPNTTSDLSAVVTGVILGLNLPVTLPIWMAVIGSFVAIVVVKNLFAAWGKTLPTPLWWAELC